MNKFTGVLGVYNCQGAAWSFVEKKTTFHHAGVGALTCGVKSSDVHLVSEAATDPDQWSGDCAVYRHGSGDLAVLPDGAALPVSLKVLEQDILTVSPIKVRAQCQMSPCLILKFADCELTDGAMDRAIACRTWHPGSGSPPVGLVDMFNSGAAVEGLTYHLLDGGKLVGDGGSACRSEEAVGLACMEVRGRGRFGAYASVRPRRCMVGSVEMEFSYDPSSRLVTLQLEEMPGERVHKIVVEL